MEIFATAEFQPKEDITTKELASVVKFTMNCSHGYGVAEPIKIYSIYGYNEFVTKYSDIIRHFKVVVYGNHKKYTTDGILIFDEKGKSVE